MNTLADAYPQATPTLGEWEITMSGQKTRWYYPDAEKAIFHYRGAIMALAPAGYLIESVEAIRASLGGV